jgi:putative hydrolase of the HAD superfamily
MSRIRALLVDAGGVLILPDPEAVRDALSNYGALPDDATCMKAHYFTMRELERDPIPCWQVIDRTYARIAGVPDEHMDEAVMAIAALYRGCAWVPAPGASNFLRRACDLGLSIVIVSNAYGTMERILNAACICSADGSAGERVAAILDSDIVGFEKPNPKIFVRAADLVSCAPQECVHIGDTVALDVRGAQAAGMVGVHVDPFDLCIGDDHLHVKNPGELFDIEIGIR